MISSRTILNPTQSHGRRSMNSPVPVVFPYTRYSLWLPKLKNGYFYNNEESKRMCVMRGRMMPFQKKKCWSWWEREGKNEQNKKESVGKVTRPDDCDDDTAKLSWLELVCWLGCWWFGIRNEVKYGGCMGVLGQASSWATWPITCFWFCDNVACLQYLEAFKICFIL